METTQGSTADHDLLIEVNTNVKNLANTLNAYTDSNNRLTQDHELRIRGLETEIQQMKGAQKSQKNQMAVLGTIFGLVSVVITIVLFVRGG